MRSKSACAEDDSKNAAASSPLRTWATSCVMIWVSRLISLHRRKVWSNHHPKKAVVAAREIIATMSSRFLIVEPSIVEVSVTSKEHPVGVCAYPKDGSEGGLVNSRPSGVSPSICVYTFGV
jgi:hypothetical protein